MFRPLRWPWGTLPRDAWGWQGHCVAWGWRGAGEQTAAPAAELCRASGWRPAASPRSPQPRSPQSPAPQQQLHRGGKGEACRASLVRSCTPSPGTSASGSGRGRLLCASMFKAARKCTASFCPQCSMGSGAHGKGKNGHLSFSGSPIPAVSVWLRN